MEATAVDMITGTGMSTRMVIATIITTITIIIMNMSRAKNCQVGASSPQATSILQPASMATGIVMITIMKSREVPTTEQPIPRLSFLPIP